MRQKGRKMRPVHVGSGFDMAFEVVCVQFHQTGHDIVALTVHRTARHGVAFFDPVDLPVDDDDLARHHPVGQNEAGIGKMQHL